MFHATARLLRLVLRLLLPAEGRHRIRTGAPADEPASRPRVPALRGEDIGLVRPYLVAHERRVAALRQKRRQGLVVTTTGVDIPGVLQWP